MIQRKEKKYILPTFVSFDIETTGFLMYEGDTIFAYVFTDWYGNSKVYRLDGKRVERKKNKLILQKFLNDTSIIKIAHNAKFEMSFCRAVGYTIPTNTVWHDTILMSKLDFNKRRSHTLDSLAANIFNYPTKWDEKVSLITKDMQKKEKAYRKENGITSKINMSCYERVHPSIMNKYQIADGERCMLLFQYFLPILYRNKPQYEDYLNEVAMLLPACNMEENGMRYDFLQHDKLYNSLEHKRKYTELKLYKALGYEINYSSSPQKLKLMADLGIKLTARTKPTKTNPKGSLAVDKVVLGKLREENKNPIFDLLLQAVSYKGGMSKLDGYKKLVHPTHKVIHPTINTLQAVTGRESVKNPSLQNISKAISAGALYGIPARKCFRADFGCIWLLIDYDGIELRLIADAVNELAYMERIRENGDVHALTGEALYRDKWDLINLLIKSPTGVKIPKWILKINQKDYNNNYKELKYLMRGGCKSFVFGNSYGGKPIITTANLLGLTSKERMQGHENFCEKYPNLAHFAKNEKLKVMNDGYVTTAFGARLFMSSRDSYMAANYKIQGTAAGILKRGKVSVANYAAFKYGEFAFDPKRENLNPLRPVISVHDENIISVHRDIFCNIDDDVAAIRKSMISHPQIKVPLEVGFDYTATNWAAKEEFNIEEFKKRFKI